MVALMERVSQTLTMFCAVDHKLESEEKKDSRGPLSLLL